MTNLDKFKEVFGFKPDGCPFPSKVCKESGNVCKDCVLFGFWHKEYKACFTLRDDLK